MNSDDTSNLSKYTPNIVQYLTKLYTPLGQSTDWIKSNGKVFTLAKNNGLVIGGSIGMAIASKKAHKIPNDIDLFTNDTVDAFNFLRDAVKFLSDKKVHYKVLINSKTEFLLPNVSHHIRIKVPFWKPICIMTLDTKINHFYSKGGLAVQNFDDIKAAASIVEAIDGKQRLPSIGDNDGNVDSLLDDFMNTKNIKKIEKNKIVIKPDYSDFLQDIEGRKAMHQMYQHCYS